MDDPLQAINRTIRKGKAPPVANAPSALTDDPSPTLDLNIPTRPPERVMRTPEGNAPQAKARRASKTASSTPITLTIEREPTLEEVLRRIDVARDADTTWLWLPHSPLRCAAKARRTSRDAYAQKIAALHAAANAGIPPDEQASPSPPPKTYAEVRDRIEHAQSLEELDEAIDMARAIPQPDYRDELLDIAHARRDGFTQ